MDIQGHLRYKNDSKFSRK